MSAKNRREDTSNNQTTNNDLSTAELPSLTHEIDYSKTLSGRLIAASFFGNNNLMLYLL